MPKISSYGNKASIVDADKLLGSDSEDSSKTVNFQYSVLKATLYASPSFTGDLTVDTDALFVDSTNKRVGIGTASPEELLHIENSSGNAFLQIISGSSSASQINFGDTADDNVGRISYFHSSDNMLFTVNAAEAMRIDANQNVLVGKSSTGGAIPGIELNPDGRIQVTRDGNTVLNINRITDDGKLVSFLQDTVEHGSISIAGSTTSYNTSSDYRLKEDFKPIESPTERIMALNPVNFAWKNGSGRVDGFIAHEVQEVIPEAVTGKKDAVEIEEVEVTPAVLDEEGNEITPAVIEQKEIPLMQGIDQSKIVPLLVATIQDLQTRLSALEGAK